MADTHVHVAAHVYVWDGISGVCILKFVTAVQCLLTITFLCNTEEDKYLSFYLFHTQLTEGAGD